MNELRLDVNEEKAESSVDQIVNGIKKLMIDRKLKVGDKLPTEFELSEIFGKSRGSVREAIKILVSYGVLKVRRGDGTYVCSSVKSNVFDPLFFQIISMKVDISELIQLRELLETGILKMVIQNPGDECFIRLSEIQGRLSDAIAQKKDIDSLVELDLRFHKCLVHYTQNTILEKIYGFMLDIFTPFIKYSYVSQSSSESYTVSNSHLMILQAVEEKDCSLAQYAINHSMKDWLRLNRMYCREKV